MKKKLIALLAGALMTVAMAGNALAYFGDVTGTDFVLTRVIYDAAGTIEVGTDIGKVTTGTDGKIILHSTGVDNGINLSLFGSSASFENLYVAYFARSQSTYDFWSSGDSTLTNGPTSSARLSNGINAGNTVNTYYRSLDTDGDGTVVADKTYSQSYWKMMDKNGTGIGTMGGTYLTVTPGVDASLAELATGGVVSQSIFFYNGNSYVGHKIATLSTLVAGNNIYTAQTPIPAAVYLLGSGLLGLVGIRRRMS